MDATQTTAKRLAAQLEELQSEVNDLHSSDESQDRNDEIELAYKAIQEAVDNLEELS